ncbi:dnaJ homolog subfamily C member 4 [Aplysia californica]|uniref:DnaJ homolog subfamily C member 4 n=1 Tax=Aplysia californica TaxID=6500 RepID=A0ABM0JZ33_APLCA|nr:dnaJ homolog subfamily C member 4 [Aplysia californica]
MFRFCRCHCLRGSPRTTFSDLQPSSSSAVAPGNTDLSSPSTPSYCSWNVPHSSMATSPNLAFYAVTKKSALNLFSVYKGAPFFHCPNPRRFITILSKANHYEVLGVEQNATGNDIRAAFLKQSKECHPDLNRKDPNNHKKFVQVNEAYSVLSKPLSRREYDLSLAMRTATDGVKSNSSGRDGNPYYHHPAHFYDEKLYSMRDKSKDEYYKSQPYYGVKGIEKISNMQIVTGCMIFMLCGIVLHFVAVKKSSDLHIKNLDARDVKTHELWMNAKKNAEMYTSKEQTEIWMQRAAEIRASKGPQ